MNVDLSPSQSVRPQKSICSDGDGERLPCVSGAKHRYTKRIWSLQFLSFSRYMEECGVVVVVGWGGGRVVVVGWGRGRGGGGGLKPVVKGGPKRKGSLA